MEREFYFKSKSGKGIEDVRQLITPATLKRSGWNKKIYIYTKDETPLYFRFKPSIGQMYGEIEKLGIEKFISTYQVSVTPPVDSKNERRQARAEKKNKKVQRKEVKLHFGLYEQLMEEKTAIVVKLMNMSMIKGSPEHMGLREQLYAIRTKLQAIPGYETFDQRMSKISSETLNELAKEGEAKKKAKRNKKKERMQRRGELKKQLKENGTTEAPGDDDDE